LDGKLAPLPHDLIWHLSESVSYDKQIAGLQCLINVMGEVTAGHREECSENLHRIVTFVRNLKIDLATWMYYGACSVVDRDPTFSRRYRNLKLTCLELLAKIVQLWLPVQGICRTDYD